MCSFKEREREKQLIQLRIHLTSSKDLCWLLLRVLSVTLFSLSFQLRHAWSGHDSIPYITSWDPHHFSVRLQCSFLTSVHFFFFPNCLLWRMDYEKPMRTGYKQGEMRLTCFSEIGTDPEAEQLHLLSCLRSEKQEHRFLLQQCHAPPREPLLHQPVYHRV
jgi:hypothetical protein